MAGYLDGGHIVAVSVFGETQPRHSIEWAEVSCDTKQEKIHGGRILAIILITHIFPSFSLFFFCFVLFSFFFHVFLS